ncbi:hypothetical protein ASG82_19440 [Mycobacterium sp. Soil538]|nr:hypothetical protein ASG82_19440 [Mycobacterium sp. Soil538]
MSRRPPRLWQRNAIACVIVAAAITVSVVTDLGPAWVSYRDTVRPQHVVPAGASATVAGQTWSVSAVRHLGRATGPGTRPLPHGAVMMTVTVDRSGSGRPEQWCMGVLTDGQRRWRGESPLMYGVRVADGAGSNCSRPGTQQWIFLIPGDAVPTALDITGSASAILVRLEL